MLYLDGRFGARFFAYRDVGTSREAGCRERRAYRDVGTSREAGCRERSLKAAAKPGFTLTPLITSFGMMRIRIRGSD